MEQSVKQRIADIQRGNVPTGYRKTKCGIIPDKWSCCQSKEIFFGKSIKNNVPELPVLSVTQENGVMLRSEMDKDISYKEDSVSSYKRVDIGDFVISLRSFEGGIEYSQCKGVVSPAYTIFSHSKDVDGSFYKYYFKTDFFITKLNTAVYGIRDGKQIGFQDFSNLFIHCPPLEEQRRIAEILGCCDRVIALKKKLIAEKKKQKKALMQKLLSPDSGFRLPGFSGEWKSVMLSECVTLGKVKISPADCDKSSKCIELEHIAVENGKLLGHCSPERVQSLKTVFHKNDILFGKLRPYLKKIILAPFDGICCSECWVLKVANNINPAFLYNRLFMDDFISASCTVSGTKMPRADWQYVKDFQLFIPEITEQQAIADILSAADKEIDLLEQELAQQEQKKKSLMQLLLTGIVRV